MTSDSAVEPQLHYSKHINYWRRNLKTFLPYHYTGNDTGRMVLAFFILSAWDILGDLDAALPDKERQDYIEWIYHCQLPEGGFRAAPATDFGSQRNEQNALWDPAHVPGTFFALINLAILGDDLERVKRRQILSWLTKLQRPDGSFGQTLGEEGRVEGGKDPRFGYMVAGIRWILRGNVEGAVDEIPDIDVDKFVKSVRRSETYDGGISEAPFHEAHAGFACCAISALALLDRLPTQQSDAPHDRIRGVSNLPLTLHWLASRQTATINEEDDMDSSSTQDDSQSFVQQQSYPTNADQKPSMEQPEAHFDLKWVGLNGRCNKIADTCYAYWSCAPLKLLGHLDLVDRTPIRRWLLDHTQHIVGGFGKLPGDPPDVYHSYLGLFTLAMFGEAGLKDVDPALCTSKRTKEHLESLPWRKRIVEHKQDH
jgi:geranylgeranyl transferase type-1 subunit beta